MARERIEGQFKLPVAVNDTRWEPSCYCFQNSLFAEQCWWNDDKALEERMKMKTASLFLFVNSCLAFEVDERLKMLEGVRFSPERFFIFPPLFFCSDCR